MDTTPLETAIEIAGGQAALARVLSTSDRAIRQGHVWAWLNRTRLTPPEFCIPIEQVTEGQVTRYELRPDIFGLAPQQEGEAA